MPKVPSQQTVAEYAGYGREYLLLRIEELENDQEALSRDIEAENEKIGNAMAAIDAAYSILSLNRRFKILDVADICRRRHEGRNDI